MKSDINLKEKVEVKKVTVIAKSLEEIKKRISENIEENKECYIQTSHAIHDRPEIGNEEYFASEQLVNILVEEGFLVEKGVAGHETAFLARKKEYSMV